MAVYFVSGIDTDSGKSIITGLIARSSLLNSESVITQKLIQTGCKGVSEDIIKHREIMGIDLSIYDKSGITCPYVMSYPASPHLAAEIDGINIDLDIIDKSTKQLLDNFDNLIIEGAGGLYVPIIRNYNTIDFISDRKYPLILVFTPKLGSINHTIMSLENCKYRGIDVRYVVYNKYPSDDKIIMEDTQKVVKEYLEKNMPKTKFLSVPHIKGGEEYPQIKL